MSMAASAMKGSAARAQPGHGHDTQAWRCREALESLQANDFGTAITREHARV